jgi:Holliday junction DNA helicase RuvB
MEGDGVITRALSDHALLQLDVDHLGFDHMDQKLIRTIIEKYDGGPVGLSTLAAAIGEEKETIEEVYEPFLIQQGYLLRTPRGRVATRFSYDHFGIPFPRGPQEEMF